MSCESWKEKKWNISALENVRECVCVSLCLCVVNEEEWLLVEYGLVDNSLNVFFCEKDLQCYEYVHRQVSSLPLPHPKLLSCQWAYNLHKRKHRNTISKEANFPIGRRHYFEVVFSGVTINVTFINIQ